LSVFTQQVKDKKRLMKVMAQELLKDQVSSLESNIASVGNVDSRVKKTGKSNATLSIVIFGLDVYLHQLDRIRSFLRRCEGWLAIVPLDSKSSQVCRV
jgi:hypothetical protein